MKKNLTEMVFILDKSGSMGGLEEDTIGGFNAMIEKQKRLDGDAVVSTVLFNHETKVLHDRVDLKAVTLMDKHTYVVGGMTALLDAVGKSIHHIRSIYAETLREDRPEKVIFVITTDGLENASREFTYAKVKAMIEETKQKYDWEFLFLGANIDASEEAGKLGINRDRSVRYMHDRKGTEVHYNTVNEAISSMRTENKINESWKKTIEDDYATRKKH